VTGTYLKHFASEVKDNFCQSVGAFELRAEEGDFMDKIGPKEFKVAC
jgi:hypothetical protein